MNVRKSEVNVSILSNLANLQKTKLNIWNWYMYIYETDICKVNINRLMNHPYIWNGGWCMIVLHKIWCSTITHDVTFIFCNNFFFCWRFLFWSINPTFVLFLAALQKFNLKIDTKEDKVWLLICDRLYLCHNTSRSQKVFCMKCKTSFFMHPHWIFRLEIARGKIFKK